MSEIHERILNSWEEFDEMVRGFQYRRWVFRGQCDSSWILRSSLSRVFSHVKKITEDAYGREKQINRTGHEGILIERFKNNAHLFIQHLPSKDNTLEWLTIMQHFGTPTRLLDFTFSPYVAAYFALESGELNSSIYCIRNDAFKEFDRNIYDDRKLYIMYRNILINNEHIIYVYEPENPSQRLLSQQGVFLVPGTLSKNHEGIIKSYNLSSDKCFKIIIPDSLRADGLKYLYKLNISASVLFPGLDGFCRTFSHQGLLPYNLEKRLK